MRHYCFGKSLCCVFRKNLSSPRRALQVTLRCQNGCSLTPLCEAKLGQWLLAAGHPCSPDNGGKCCIVFSRQGILKSDRMLGSLYAGSTGCSALDISASADMDTSKEIQNAAQLVKEVFIDSLSICCCCCELPSQRKVHESQCRAVLLTTNSTSL